MTATALYAAPGSERLSVMLPAISPDRYEDDRKKRHWQIIAITMPAVRGPGKIIGAYWGRSMWLRPLSLVSVGLHHGRCWRDPT
jgi:hypothetical protein